MSAGCGFFDECPCTVVVNGFEIFYLHAVPKDVWIRLAAHSHVANEILYEHGIGVSLFGHMFFIRSLEEAVKFGAGRLLCESDHFLNPERLGGPHREGDMPALVVCPTGTDRLRAGTEGCDRDGCRNDEVQLVDFERGFEANQVIHEPWRSCHGRLFFKKEWKLDIKVGATAFQA